MKTNTHKWMLLATLVLGLGIAITSCKDDDEDKKKTEQGPDTQTGMSELQDDQLRDLICQWCDVQKDELAGNAWKNQTFEPTIGFVDDESTPFYRSLPVGTLEEADLYAVQALGTLGIDGNNPDGFSYSDDKVGTVSYRHSRESNILGVIDVEVRQLPRMMRLYLTRQAGENASGTPYYHCSDVIKYKNRYYVCVSDHKYGEKARFVTFNDQSEHSTGTFGWYGQGDDVVYNDDMASPETILDWFNNIFSSRQSRDFLRMQLLENHLTEEQINQVVPATEDQTYGIFNYLTDEYYKPTDSRRSGAENHVTSFTWQVLKECEGDPYTADFDEKDERNIQKFLITPYSLFLTNRVRWRINFTSSWDQWVPYITLIKDSGFKEDKKILDNQACLTTLSPSHFALGDLGTVYMDEDLHKPNEANMALRGELSKGTYHVVMLALYWQHDIFLYQEVYPTRMLFDFTRDYSLKPGTIYQIENKGEYKKAYLYWPRRCVTSKEITFTDKGKAQSKYESVNR